MLPKVYVSWKYIFASFLNEVLWDKPSHYPHSVDNTDLCQSCSDPTVYVWGCTNHFQVCTFKLSHLQVCTWIQAWSLSYGTMRTISICWNPYLMFVLDCKISLRYSLKITRKQKLSPTVVPAPPHQSSSLPAIPVGFICFDKSALESWLLKNIFY